MHIERIQVEEGFLDGLDVTLKPGLNVIIGHRGTGKTSLIELIRFCLGVKGYTSESSRRSIDHALSVLGSGQITITLNSRGQQLTVSRSAEDEEPRSSGLYLKPTIFSQTEIESVGLHGSGRLMLIDGFVKDRKRNESAELSAIGQVRSLTSELDAVRREIVDLERQVVELPQIEEQLTQLASSEQEVSKISEDAALKKRNLDDIVQKSSRAALSASFIERVLQGIAKLRSALMSAQQSLPAIQPWPTDAGADPLVECRASLKKVREYLDAAAREATSAETKANQASTGATADRLAFEEQGRPLRKEIESLQAGAGSIVRKGQQLREQKARLQSLNVLLLEKRAICNQLKGERDSALDRLDEFRKARFDSRISLAKELTTTLGPRIRIEVERAAQFEEVSVALAQVLRGSGLKYSDLSSTLAQRVSPRELLDAVEANDFESIADTADISKDRAARVIAQLRETDLGQFATIPVEDDVSLELLDGQDYKKFTDLSTGQRCTVVLPLILRHTDRVLIVDQPEDHIDNAFIVDTLIKSLLARPKDSQFIFSTHNANIPVLGEADQVIQLSSDGRRGFVNVAAPLNDDKVVDAITTVMEGGAAAFLKRAAFYKKHRS
jgi:chromosome segregation ATPase